MPDNRPFHVFWALCRFYTVVPSVYSHRVAHWQDIAMQPLSTLNLEDAQAFISVRASAWWPFSNVGFSTPGWKALEFQIFQYDNALMPGANPPNRYLERA